MCFKFTDVKPMIQRKILRNSLAQKLLKSRMEIFQKEAEICKICIELDKAKIKMLDTMNTIERMQLDEYSKDREKTILDISKSIEEMDNDITNDINSFQSEVKKIKTTISKLNNQIELLNYTIPKEGVATNYRVNFNESISYRCIP